MPTAALALSIIDSLVELERKTGKRMTPNRWRTIHLLAGGRIANLLSGRLLALRLEGRGSIVRSALELVSNMLGGRLLRVGLKRGCEWMEGMGQDTAEWSRSENEPPALSVKD